MLQQKVLPLVTLGDHPSAGKNSALEHCDRPVGTMSVYEDRSAEWCQAWLANMRGDRTTTSIVPVIRLLAQQSNCFAVVERGRAMDAMARERGLMDAGELRKHSNFGKGQMAATDYTLEPNIIVGSITDAYNNLVKAVKIYKAQESASPNGHGTGGSMKVN